MQFRVAAGLIAGSLASVGFLTNAFLVAYLHCTPELHGSVWKLIYNQAVADALHQAIFVFAVSPAMIVDIPYLTQNSSKIGFLLLVCYNVCSASHFMLSVNRYCITNHPSSNVVRVLFSNRRTKIMIALSWILSIAYISLAFHSLDCSLLLPKGETHFSYHCTENSRDNSLWNLEFFKYFSFVCSVAALDFKSLQALHLSNKAAFACIGEDNRAQRARAERYLTWQVCLQGVFFSSELITYFWFSAYVSSEEAVFLMTTVSWILVHGVDGIIVLTFNGALRKVVLQRWFGWKQLREKMRSSIDSSASPSPVSFKESTFATSSQPAPSTAPSSNAHVSSHANEVFDIAI